MYRGKMYICLLRYEALDKKGEIVAVVVVALYRDYG